MPKWNRVRKGGWSGGQHLQVHASSNMPHMVCNIWHMNTVYASNMFSIYTYTYSMYIWCISRLSNHILICFDCWLLCKGFVPTARATATANATRQQQQHGKIAFYSVRIFHLLHLMLPKLSSKIHFLREHEFSDAVAHITLSFSREFL